MDLKIRGISLEILKEALAQSRGARIDILRTMLKTLPRPESKLSENAPRLLVTMINPEKIGMLIGPGGKNIRAIQEETNTVVEVSEDGRVTIAGADGNLAEAALKKVEACTATVQVGKIYDGTVSSVKDFGAFVEILPGRDGLCHISELSDGYIDSVEDICQIGDEMKVIVIDVDGTDRIKLSRRQALEELGLEDEFAKGEDEGGSGDNDGDDDGDRESSGDREGGDRGGRGRSSGGGDRGGSGGGRGRSGGGGRGRSGGGGGRSSGGGGGRSRSGGGDRGGSDRSSGGGGRSSGGGGGRSRR